MADDRNAAREYLRVSIDRSGRERSITEQHEENERAAAGHGFTLGPPYADNGSASRYAAKARGDFATLLADLDGGRFGAEVLLLWESSRGSRKVGEWVELIESCEQHGVRIHVTTHGRTYDPANPRDRRSLLEDAVDSEFESAKISVRAKRAAAANAAAGRPHGRVPYGYKRTYDPTSGRLAAQEPDPAEAPIVRELFARIVAGHSLRGIARDFEARGIVKRSGGPFSAQHLRSMALNRAYIGQRVHDPGRKGRKLSDRQQVVDDAWPAIVDLRAWHAAQRILADESRKTVRPGRARHLLSMIALCDVCSGPLAVTTRNGAAQYQCHRKGCVRLGQAGVDEIAVQVILGFLSRPDNVARLLADDGAGGRLQQVREEISSIRAELDELAAQVGAGKLSAALAARAEPGILARLREAEGREADLTTPARLRGLITPGKDVARRWKAAPMAARREIARILLTADLLGELRVVRAGSGRRVPAVDRLVWRRRP